MILFDTEHVFKQIEDPEMFAITGIASGRRLFRSIVRKQPVYKTLLGVASSAIVNRIELLCSLTIDEAYLNPHDTALAIYLLALYDKDTAKVVDALYIVHTQAKNIFWPKHVLMMDS